MRTSQGVLGLQLGLQTGEPRGPNRPPARSVTYAIAGEIDLCCGGLDKLDHRFDRHRPFTIRIECVSREAAD